MRTVVTICKGAFLSSALVILVGSAAAVKGDETGFSYDEGHNLLVYGGRSYAVHIGDPNSPARARVYAKTVGTGVEKILYSGSKTLTNLQVSPDGETLSLVEYDFKEDVSPGEANYVDQSQDEKGNVRRRYYYVNPRLVLLTIDGKPVASFDYVYTYAWSPGGGSIAYITGTYHEGGLGFRSTGLWIYDVARKQTMKIHHAGYQIYWSSFDGNLYILQLRKRIPVERYDPSSGTVVPTPRVGIYLSPDGRHYFRRTGEDEFHLYSLPENQDINSEHPILQNSPFIEPAWSPDGQVLLFRKPMSTGSTLAYNVYTRTIREMAGEVVGFARKSRQVALVLPGQSDIHFEPW